jgi:hypothetical protein
VECNLKIKIRVWINVALCWRDGEVLVGLGGDPLEVGLHISEVAHLESLSEAAILDDLTEGHNFIHDLKLDAMGGSED